MPWCRDGQIFVPSMSDMKCLVVKGKHYMTGVVLCQIYCIFIPAFGTELDKTMSINRFGIMVKMFFRVVAALLVSFGLVLPASSASASARKTQREDGRGHVLVSLWKKYESVKDSDLPDRETAVLEDIISTAEKKHLPWDFYDAWREYRNVVVSRDWKQRASVDSAMAESVSDFDEPVVSCRHLMDDMGGWVHPDSLAAFAVRNAARLKSSHNRGFYTEFYSPDPFSSRRFSLPESVRDCISDDYEYVLWSAASGLYGGGQYKSQDLLSDYISGTYPNGAYLDYLVASNSGRDTRKAALENFIREYEGRAVSLFAMQSLLMQRFNDLQSDRDADPDAFLALRKDCGDFEKLRKSFTGGEKKIAADCNGIETLVKTLDGKSMYIEGHGDTLYVKLRNLDRFNLSVKPEGKDSTVFSGEFSVGEGRYFVFDTVKVVLPVLDDGSYDVDCESGDVSVSSSYCRNTVSLAYRKGKEGIFVYAADYRSGRPLEKADVDIYLKDTLVYSFNDLKFSGFIRLDVDFPCADSIRNEVYKMVCSSTDGNGTVHRSPEVDFRFPSEPDGQEDTSDYVSCMLMTDRAAFRAGDTVSFKAVLYDNGYEVLPEGEAVDVFLLGPNDEHLDSLCLHTNGFGSVAGTFHIPEDRLNGEYCIEVYHHGSLADSRYFVVGEIELPTFDLVFDPCDTIYFPGDSITVSGILRSYSGRRLSDADVRWTVTGMTAVPSSGRLVPGEDGRFSFGFRDTTAADRSAYYNIKVKVTDITGETYEFYDFITAAPRFSLSVHYENPAEGRFVPLEYAPYESMTGHGYAMTGDDMAMMTFSVMNASMNKVNCPDEVSYNVYFDGKSVMSGKTAPGGTAVLDFTGMPSGLYRMVAEAEASMKLPDGKDSVLVSRYVYELARVMDGDTSIGFDARNLFRKTGEGDCIGFQMGTTSGPVWAVVELWGESPLVPLRSGIVYLDGEKGREGSLVTLEYPFDESYPDNVSLSVFYFKDGTDYRYSADYHRRSDDTRLPLSFSSFTDRAGTGEKVTVTVDVPPFTESAVAVFDAASEKICSNALYPVSRIYDTPYVYTFSHTGFAVCRGIIVRGNAAMLEKSAYSPASCQVDVAASRVENVSEDAYAGNAGTDVEIRKDFDNTLAFIPFLRSGQDTTVTFSFNTSDKLSTYKVMVFTHDRSMRNNVLDGEILVTEPVEVSVTVPGFLHEGDKYVMKASVSNNSDSDLSGVLEMFLYDTEDYEDAVPLMAASSPVSVKAGTSASEIFPVDIMSGKEVCGFKLVFDCSDAGQSDGIFVSVPVIPDVQTLTEAHSAVLRHGMDLDSLKSELSGKFSGVSPFGAESREYSLIDMVKDAVPEKSRVSGDNAVALSDALYVRMLSGCIRSADVKPLTDKILRCRNSDGGFGWFCGMESSCQVTALLLERAAEIARRTHVQVFGKDVEEAALMYLDAHVFSGLGDSGYVPWSGISLPEYLYVRSMYPDVPAVCSAGGEPVSKSGLKEFSKAVKSYLTAPTGAALFDGRLVDKARRASVIMHILEYADRYGSGTCELLDSWGLKGSLLKKISKVLDQDMASVMGHAVEHESGGVYFPNAVMPFRGLLDSELYAHSLICDALQDYASIQGESSDRASSIADGVRLWMMVQKESQQWDDDPAFVRAIASVLSGSADVLSTKIVVLSKKYEKPFDKIKASGNGFKVEKKFCREIHADGGPVLEELCAGDTLHVGDKIICLYTVWSSENRSFVRLTVPRCASLRPVDQISGMTWLPFRPLSKTAGTGGSGNARMWNPAPAGYRNVLADRTEYYFDVFPEETTVIEEEFYVTQSGVFTSAVPEVECVYAPHYRANGGFESPVPVM